VRVVGTAGHVDHGKSTLVQALTGIDPDRFDEEKRRGLTIDLGFAWYTLPSGLPIGIVDVPGHERFIRNMLAGVGAIDAVLFVVAADEGWMPQSAEHLQILDFLGVDRGVVALTKTDIAGELADAAEDDVREHLRGTALEDAPMVRVSAKTGDGLDELSEALDEALRALPDEEETGRVRLFIDRSFTITGAGAVVTGTLSAGRITVGDEVTILPDKRRARVRSLQTHGEQVQTAEAPRRLAVNLVGIDRRLIHRGDVIVCDPWILADRFAARLFAARELRHPLKQKGAYELFVGTAQTRCRLRFLEEVDELAPGSSALAIISTDLALPVIPHDRFVIRDVGRWETVAGGYVIDQDPPKRLSGADSYLDDLRAREGLHGTVLAEWILQRDLVMDQERLMMLAGTGPRQVGKARLDMMVDGFYFARGSREMLERRLTDALAAYHEAHPLAAGMPLSEAKDVLGIDACAVEALFAEIEEHRGVDVDGNVVRLPGHSGPELTVAERNAANRALRMLRDADASPPELDNVGLSQQLARALERAGELVFLTPSIAYPSDIWSDIEHRVVGFITDNGSATVSQIRDTIGTTRKYAVPLLEKLDATGVTRRKGDVRDLGPRGRDLAAKIAN